MAYPKSTQRRSKHESFDARRLRNRLKLNQTEFWGRVAVTQSGGSRYENGRSMSAPVRKLLGIVYLKERP